MKKSIVTSLVKNTKLIQNILVPLLIVSIFFMIAFLSIERKSSTTDEKYHLVRGLMLLETGDLRLNQHHPYLFNLIAALPTKFDKDLVIPSLESENWLTAKKDDIAVDLVILNGGNFEFSQKVLYGPRVMLVLVTAGLLFITYLYVKKLFGFTPAAITTSLLALDPNFIGHARIVTTDATSTLTLFLAALLFYDYFKNKKRYDQTPIRTYLLLGVVSTIALISKYTAVFAIAALIGSFFLIGFISYKKDPFIKRVLKAAKQPLILTLVILILMTAAYKFQFNQLSEMVYGRAAKLEANLHGFQKIDAISKPLGEFLERIYLNVPVPFPQYLNGFYENVFKHNLFGHRSFLLGETSNKGWWYYFPIAFIVKEPLLVVITFMISLILSIWELLKKKIIIKPEAYALLIPPILIFFLAIQSNINLGIRHLLPIFPFIYLLIAERIRTLTRKYDINKTMIALIIVIALAVPNFRIFPHYISYFNILVGPPTEGYKVLRDSNFDWNQNDLLAQDYIDAHAELDITKSYKKFSEHDYLMIPIENLYGSVEKRDDYMNEIHELLDSGEAQIVQQIAITYALVEFK